MRTIPPAAVDLVATNEGLRLESYEDSAGQWTIGYGHTGPEVGAGKMINKVQARALLIEDLETAAERLEKIVKPEILRRISQSQYAALLSFVFNVGADPRWTIWRRLNAGHFDQVPLELLKFVNAGGRRLMGLVNRRTAEAKLWYDDAPDDRPVPPSSVLRAQGAIPTPADPTSVLQSPSALTSIAGALAAAPVLINQVVSEIAPYTGAVGAGPKILGALAGLAGALTSVGAVLNYTQRRASQR